MEDEIKKNIELCKKYKTIINKLRSDLDTYNIFQCRVLDKYLYDAEDWFQYEIMDLEKLMKVEDI